MAVEQECQREGRRAWRKVGCVISKTLLSMIIQNGIKWNKEKHSAFFFFWFFNILAETKSVCSTPKQAIEKEILELSPCSKPSKVPSYYNTTLNKLETEGQFTYETVDELRSSQVTHYDDAGPHQEDIYQEIDSGVHYQPLLRSTVRLMRVITMSTKIYQLPPALHANRKRRKKERKKKSHMHAFELGHS